MLLLVCLGAGDLELVADGTSGYTIVVGDAAIPAERSAARELALHIEQMSGGNLPIVESGEFTGGPAIAVGPSSLTRKLASDFDSDKFGREEYLIRSVGDDLVIAGGRPRGTLYGVYHLLDKQLGCRWFTPDTSFIPKLQTIEVARQDRVGRPSFAYREPWMYVGGPPRTGYWWRDHFDPAYVARIRHSSFLIEHQMHVITDEFGGRFNISHFGHNFKDLVPAAKYANDHPDYYALYKGARTTSGDLGLCLTHPEMRKVAVEAMRNWMRDDPDADQFFLGQPDSGKRCQCDRCNAAYKRYSREIYDPSDTMRGSAGDPAIQGGFAGVLVEFANEIASGVEGEFPDRKIGMFVYESSILAPRDDVKLHKNLAPWFCTAVWTRDSGIRCSCHPPNRGPTNKTFWDFPRIMADWRRIAPDAEMFAYEYFIAWHLGLPHDLFTIPETVRWHYSQTVRGMEIDSVKEIQSGFGFLRNWLWAQMLNDVDFDFEAGLTEFLRAYYGEAAESVREFIDLSSDPSSYHPLSDEKARNYYPPGSPHYDELVNSCRILWRKPKRDALEMMYEIFEQAEEAVLDDAKASEHLAAARMCLQYVLLEELPPDDPRLRDEATRLVSMIEKLEMPYVGGRETLEDYRRKITERIGWEVPKP
jgi:hypothetical protein